MWVLYVDEHVGARMNMSIYLFVLCLCMFQLWLLYFTIMYDNVPRMHDLKCRAMMVNLG
jgi:hypothetical protein